MFGITCQAHNIFPLRFDSSNLCLRIKSRKVNKNLIKVSLIVQICAIDESLVKFLQSLNDLAVFIAIIEYSQEKVGNA